MSESKRKNDDSEQSNLIAYRSDQESLPAINKKSGLRTVCSDCRFSAHEVFNPDGWMVYRKNRWCLAEWNGRHPTTGRRRRVSDTRALAVGAKRCHVRNKGGECGFFSPNLLTRILRRIGLR